MKKPENVEDLVVGEQMLIDVAYNTPIQIYTIHLIYEYKGLFDASFEGRIRRFYYDDTKMARLSFVDKDLRLLNEI